MEVVPIVDNTYGMPVRAATRATAVHQPDETGRGDTMGRAAGRPRIIVEVSTVETSCNTCGWNSTRA